MTVWYTVTPKGLINECSHISEIGHKFHRGHVVNSLINSSVTITSMLMTYQGNIGLIGSDITLAQTSYPLVDHIVCNILNITSQTNLKNSKKPAAFVK